MESVWKHCVSWNVFQSGTFRHLENSFWHVFCHLYAVCCVCSESGFLRSLELMTFELERFQTTGDLMNVVYYKPSEKWKLIEQNWPCPQNYQTNSSHIHWIYYTFGKNQTPFLLFLFQNNSVLSKVFLLLSIDSKIVWEQNIFYKSKCSKINSFITS